MKKVKTILALILIAALILTIFAACAKTDPPVSDPPSAGNESKEPSTSVDTPADSSDVEPEDKVTYDPEDLVEIELRFFCTNGVINSTEEVEAAINAITEPEIGVTVRLNAGETGAYIQGTSLALSAGEPVDIFERGFGPLGFGSLYANNQMKDLTDLLPEHAPALYELMKEYFGAVSIDGRIYGIPAYRAYNQNCYIVMHAQMLKDLGLYEKAEKMTSWKEFEEIMQAVKENYDLMYPIAIPNETDGVVMAGATFADSITYDSCGDTLRLLGAFDGRIQCIFQMEDKEQQYQRNAEWLQKGWLWPDSSVSDTGSSDMMRQGVTFSEIVASEIGIESAKLSSLGFECLCVPVTPIAVGTAHLQKFGLSIAEQCEEPEAALRLLNLMYTDPELANLFVMGIEGKDYVLNGEGVASYPGGKRENVNYHMDEYAFGNQFLLVPWEGTSADFRETSLEMFKNSPVSDYLGFAVSTSGLDTEVAALSAVYEQYIGSLVGGMYTPELMEEVQQKLTVAGIDTYINAMQTQLDAWIAANK